MLRYDQAHVEALSREVPFRERPVERPCPACGKTAVRTYLYGSDRRGRPTIISYTWCANCRRYHGSVGPRMPGFDFTDPLAGLSTQQRIEMEKGAFFEKLDRMWEAGELPQEFFTT